MGTLLLRSSVIDLQRWELTEYKYFIKADTLSKLFWYLYITRVSLFLMTLYFHFFVVVVVGKK